MGGVTLLDGGLGQEVHKRSGQPAHPMWGAEVMKRDPALVEEVHRDYLNAGARVITINSYPLTPTRLKRDGSIEDFEPLQHKAIELAQKAVRDFPEAQIAGCLPPLVGSYSFDNRSRESLEEEYKQIVDIEKNDVDLFIAETIPSLREAEAAVAAVRGTRKPVLLSFNLADDGSDTLRSGESLSELVRALDTINPDALLFNCSFPESITSGIKCIKDGTNLPYGGYGNAFTSVDPLTPGGTVDALEKRHDLTAQNYAVQAMQWIDQGATIVGGCCEVGPEYIEELRKSIRQRGMEIVPFKT
eukprot:gb/GECG01016482.1/.p1 GENE.gb/GECG01016482.1/~~gb/GECG01016482.1/.p1  ORF type:complete len:301 (+),score=42.30 gb/GECG01016482.1/:1-903(+)